MPELPKLQCRPLLAVFVPDEGGSSALQKQFEDDEDFQFEDGTDYEFEA